MRYAKALFEFAAEKGCDERVYGQMGKLAAAFVREVLHNRRERFLQWIALMYREQYRKAHGISTGKLETAVPVAPDTERRLKELIEAQTRGTLELEASVKPDLIGGFVFEMNCERLDASVATQLRSIRRQFAEKNRRIV